MKRRRGCRREWELMDGFGNDDGGSSKSCDVVIRILGREVNY